MWDLKYDTNELTNETETASQTQRETCGCQEGEGVGGTDKKFGTGRWTLTQRTEEQ